MRLVFVISSLTAGGAERVMTTLANAYAGRGHDVRLLTTHDRGRPPHYALDPGVRLDSADPRTNSPAKQLMIARALRKRIRRAQPDAVISFLNYTNVLTLAACVGLRVPVIVSERLDPRIVRIGRAWELARRITYRRAARLVAQTKTAAGLFEPLAPGRTRVIANPVSLPPAAAPRTGGGGAIRRTVLAVGRLQRQKGYDVALRAMSLLPPGFASWRLVVLGEGPLRDDLLSLRDELGLRERVEFAGRVADPWSWYRQADIYLMSSRTEGFPNALCEAMAAGLPVLVTDCPSGPADIVTPEVDGLMVPPEDPQAMAQALARLMAEPELRAKLAAAAPAVAQRYSLESVLASWDALLAETTGGKPS